MNTVLLYFSDIVSGITPQNEQLPGSVQFVEVSKSKENFIQESVFHSLVKFLKSPIDTSIISVCTSALPNWNTEVWKKHLSVAKENGSSIYRQNGASLQSYEVADLKMALDQNYRPVFEDISEAYTTFGFKATEFSPDNVIN
ncbi:MAG: hypothetical protein HKN39_07815 [Flavobacteriales bacterium]|nr:hypothetical protein [Flavobacteriales bacterium]